MPCKVKEKAPTVIKHALDMTFLFSKPSPPAVVQFHQITPLPFLLLKRLPTEVG